MTLESTVTLERLTAESPVRQHTDGGSLRQSTMRGGRTQRPLVIVTRVRLRRARDMFVAWRRYRRILAAARSSPGFIASDFLVRDHRTFVTLSVWRDESSVDGFEAAAMHLHPDAVRWANTHATDRWSTVARQAEVSRSSSSWPRSLVE